MVADHVARPSLDIDHSAVLETNSREQLGAIPKRLDPGVEIDCYDIDRDLHRTGPYHYVVVVGRNDHGRVHTNVGLPRHAVAHLIRWSLCILGIV